MTRLLRTTLITLAGLVLAFAASWLIYMPDAAQRGTWRAQTGYMILALGPLSAQAYGASSHSCGLLYDFPAHLKLVELLEGVQLSTLDETLRLTIDGQIDPIDFDRIPALPAPCATPPDPTPRVVFDALWTAMDEHYAFFDLYGVDWDARRALAPAPDAQMSDAALFALLQETLAGLDDGHLQLGAAGLGFFTPKQPPPWFPPDTQLNRATLRNLALAHAGAEMSNLPDTALAIGLRDDRIAYIIIHEMAAHTSWGQGQQAAMADHFENLAPMLATAKGIVLDVRYNPGGSDPVALGIVSHFISEPTLAFTKTIRTGDTQSAPFAAWITPYDDTPITIPTVLLTSDLTGSAAEIFTMAMRGLPQVTTMGEPTGGGLSDILGFTLPNGWSLGLSNQTYLTRDGAAFEAIGIPPDIAVPFEATAFSAGTDPVLVAAFAHLNRLSSE